MIEAKGETEDTMGDLEVFTKDALLFFHSPLSGFWIPLRLLVITKASLDCWIHRGKVQHGQA